MKKQTSRKRDASTRVASPAGGSASPQSKALKRDAKLMRARQRPGVLRARFYKRDSDIMFVWPPGRTKRDAHLLRSIFSEENVDLLSAAGYDITTLEFSIRLRGKPNDPDHARHA